MTTTERPPLTRQEKATRLLAIAVLKARIATEERRLRDELTRELVTGSREAGVIDPADAEATALGFVTKKKPATSAKVTDAAAVLAWTEQHCPDEVQVTRSVRPAFLTRLLDKVKETGGWVTGDGELVDVPGVEVSTGAPSLMVKASEDADRLVAEALAGRRLELLGGEDQ